MRENGNRGEKIAGAPAFHWIEEDGMQQKNPVRVLQIGMTKNPGGLETYLMQQFDHIHHEKLMYDFVNITAEDEIVYRDHIEENGGKVYGVFSRHSNPVRHYWQWFSLLRKVAGNYHAIVLNANNLAYVYPLLLAKFFGIKKRIIHSHNAGFEFPVGFARKILIAVNTILLKYAATDYFACSQKAGEWMFGKNQTFRVIHNAIETRDLRYDEPIRQEARKELGVSDRFVMGHVGRFSYQKNHLFLLDIFHEVHKKKPDAVLLLVGDAVNDMSFWEQAKEKVEILGLAENVKFLGLRKDVPRLMQAMDCFLLPSRFEGLPLVGIEAQAAGLPCFFSDTITKEVGITDLAHFISLETSPAKWAEEILEKSQIPRRDTSEEIAAAGYDIEKEIGEMEKFYLG